MSELADFLDRRRDAIVARFTEQVASTLGAAGLTRGEIVDHLPDFLVELADVLRTAGPPEREVLATSATARAHGGQRLRLGYDVDAVVREYGLLRDGIYQELEDAGLTPSVRELRVLSDRLSAAVADSVGHFVAEHREVAEGERRTLLGLFEQSPGFVAYLRGPELVFELANAAYYQLVGHREMIGRPAREALPEVEGQGFFELLDAIMAGGPPFVGRGMRVELQRSPGAPLTEAFVDLIYQPIVGEGGAVIGILAQGNEVTELRRLEVERVAAVAALAASEERYRTLFASIDDGFCLIKLLFDDAGRAVDYAFLEANAAFEGQTGLRGAVGRRVLELVPDLDDSWFDLYGRVATTGEAARFENHAPAMGRWFDVYANRVGDPALRQVAIVFKDVTARKQAEAERERLYALERTARAEAEEAGRLRDEFLATVSHELRTPLSAILGWSQMLQTEALPPEKRVRGLATIERNARAQAQLIEDLLDVSRILAGKLRLEVDTVDVRAIVEAALESVRPAADAKGIRLQAVLASAGAVMGDPHRLQQVVWNLVSNAVKFTPRGGRVQILVERRDSAVDVTVADTGQGISPEFLPHIFERFRQAEGSSTRSHGGLGLGLSIVRHLVELHGGTVSVYSGGEGKGASFTVRLPIAVTSAREPTAGPEVARAAQQSGVRCPPELAGLRILVVDDEEDSRDMLRTLLEGCGAVVDTAASVAEALARFEARPPQILLSDVGMPVEDGHGLIRRIRARPADAGGTVPAIALTAYARGEDRTRALLAGFDSHVAKPVEPIELLVVIASLAGRTRPPAGG